MTVYCISRHPGAVEWLRQEGVQVDVVIAHMEGLRLGPGDTVIGTLPIRIAAECCAAGALVLALCIEVPAGLRGCELTADEMRRHGACLRRFVVFEKDVYEKAGHESGVAFMNKQTGSDA